MGDKLGDNGQLERVGDALAAQGGWEVSRRRVEMLPRWVRGKPAIAASLHHIDHGRSDPLEPPWPDVVVTIGRRPSMVALWIKERSGRKTRIVRLGKPTGTAEIFDLVIASAEVQILPAPNVVRIGMPLMGVDRKVVDADADRWRPQMAALPRPLVGLLLGGPTQPFRFDGSVVQAILDRAAAVLGEGGTPWLVTSRRTPPAVTDALARRLPEGAKLYRWSPDDPANPYRALLALADGLVVTGDSISMLVEVARLRRPLQILPLPIGPLGRLDLLRRRATFSLAARANRPFWRPVASLAAGGGQARDHRAFHAMLLARSLAAPLGAPFRPPTGEADDDLDRVVVAIKGLVGA